MWGADKQFALIYLLSKDRGRFREDSHRVVQILVDLLESTCVVVEIGVSQVGFVCLVVPAEEFVGAEDISMSQVWVGAHAFLDLGLVKCFLLAHLVERRPVEIREVILGDSPILEEALRVVQSRRLQVDQRVGDQGEKDKAPNDMRPDIGCLVMHSED